MSTAPSDFLPAERQFFAVARSKGGAAEMAPAEDLGRFEFWTPNAAACSWLVVVDIDHPDGLVRALWTALPRPTYTIENPLNGHAQAAWAVEAVAHGPNARRAPERFLEAVTYALAQAVGGDPAFAGARCRNPLWEGAQHDGRVHWGPTEPRTLGELKAVLEAAGLWVTRPRAEAAPVVPSGVATEGARNCAVFDAARFAAYAGQDPEAAARAVVCVPPLPEAEIRGIIRSVTGFMERQGRAWKAEGEAGGAVPDAWREARAEMGRKGGKAGTSAQQESRAKGTTAAAVVRSAAAVGRAAEVRALAEAGMTRRQIMDRLGLSESTVKRALRAGRTGSAGGGVSTGASGKAASAAPAEQANEPPAEPVRPARSARPEGRQTTPAPTPKESPDAPRDDRTARPGSDPERGAEKGSAESGKRGGRTCHSGEGRASLGGGGRARFGGLAGGGSGGGGGA